MRKNILYIGIVLIIGLMLLGLTGCKEKNENDINNINDISDVSNVENNDSNNNQQNSINNETNISNNNAQQSNSKKETDISKNENKKVDKKDDAQQNNQIKETSTPVNENKTEVKPETKNETTETTQNEKTLKVGDYVLHYGKYTGNGTKYIDKVVSATITINLKEDGTYTYTSTNQDVSKNRSGTYTVKSNKTIVLNDSEPLEYTVMGEDFFVELQGSGFSFTYQGN